jgi:hypothetical protein
MDPDIHARVERAGRALGMDINGLLNLIIRKTLPDYEGLVSILADPKTAALVPRWRELNPGRGIDDFYLVYSVLKVKKDTFFKFEDGKLYRLNDAGNDFEEIGPDVDRWWERSDRGQEPSEQR